MSYILDALRRAEAQRSRGGVPHLHAPVPGLDSGPNAPAAPSPLRRHAAWAVAAVSLVVAAAAWWRPGGGPAPAPSPAPSASPSVIPPSTIAPVAGTTAAASPAVPTSAASPPARAQHSEPSGRRPPPAEPAPRPPAAPVVHRRELPAAVQRELPPLSFGGTVYAQRPSERMLVVNGEVWREGDRIAQGVLVEEIRRKDAVLSFKGRRFILAP